MTYESNEEIVRACLQVQVYSSSMKRRECESNDDAAHEVASVNSQVHQVAKSAGCRFHKEEAQHQPRSHRT